MRSLAFALAAVALSVACSNSTEPQKSFNICVHAQDAPFVPGSTGDACTVAQQVRSGQTRTIDVEADKRTGDDRSATLAIEFAPTGWTVTLGGTTVPVPGKQTLTIDVPTSATPGVYQIAIRATSNGEQVISVFRVTVINPV